MMPTAAAASETSSPESGVFCAVPTAAEVTTYLPLVQQVVARLQAWGGLAPEERAGRTEHVVFALPRTLREVVKPAG